MVVAAVNARPTLEAVISCLRESAVKLRHRWEVVLHSDLASLCAAACSSLQLELLMAYNHPH